MHSGGSGAARTAYSLHQCHSPGNPQHSAALRNNDSNEMPSWQSRTCGDIICFYCMRRKEMEVTARATLVQLESRQ